MTISIRKLAKGARVHRATATRWFRGERVAARSQRRIEQAFVELGGVLFNGHWSGQIQEK